MKSIVIICCVAALQITSSMPTNPPQSGYPSRAPVSSAPVSSPASGSSTAPKSYPAPLSSSASMSSSSPLTYSLQLPPIPAFVVEFPQENNAGSPLAFAGH